MPMRSLSQDRAFNRQGKRMSPYIKAVIAIVTFVILAGGVVVGSYREFCTVREHKEDVLEVKLELAGVSLFQQQLSTQQQIKWLENDIRDFYKRHGQPPYRDSGIRADYEELMRKLEDERKALVDIRSRIKK